MSLAHTTDRMISLPASIIEFIDAPGPELGAAVLLDPHTEDDLGELRSNAGQSGSAKPHSVTLLALCHR